MDFGLTPESLRAGLIFYFLLFAVLVLRAFAQAWLADSLGDPTPRSDGRVTLYPPPHVDLLGTVVLPLICIFYLQPRLAQINFFLAWTRPVPTNPSYFKHARRDELLTQFAGFGMCVLIAFIAAVAGGLLYHAEPRSAEISVTLIGIAAMLMVLDLLPIPPLPGGMLLRHWGILSEEAFWNLSRWSGLVLLIAFQLPPVRDAIGALVALIASPFVILLRLIAR
ncbi:MAG: site-2 protease family protein [Opitutus sp.]|nr:site-2 protease family protein [Opitutus sp.]